jgi:hypothetical protein
MTTDKYKLEFPQKKKNKVAICVVFVFSNCLQMLISLTGVKNFFDANPSFGL